MGLSNYTYSWALNPIYVYIDMPAYIYIYVYRYVCITGVSCTKRVKEITVVSRVIRPVTNSTSVQ